MNLRHMLRRFAAYWNLFPCPVCGGEGNGRNEFCPDCRALLHPVREPRCPGCGGTLDGMLASCSKCMQEELRPWSYALAVYDYRGAGRELVRAFKFSDHPELARPLSQLAAPLLRECGEPIDLIVPVPLHVTRCWTRGYNQSLLLAQLCAAELGVPCVEALRRTRRTPHQAGLSREKRLKNLKNAFTVCNAASIAGKNVWLLDDVLTTGTTLNEAAETLRAAGAGPIRILVIARA